MTNLLWSLRQGWVYAALTCLLSLPAQGMALPCDQVCDATLVGNVTSEVDFTLDALFNNDRLFGKTAKDLAWSKDSRFLAFRWNIFDATGEDVWIYDTCTRQARAVTSATAFQQFDPEARLIVEAQGKADSSTPEYKGVASFVWSSTGHDLILDYRNDLYRLDLGSSALERLTKTQGGEDKYQFTTGDDGYLYWRGNALYRVRFNSSFFEELFPNIPAGRSIDEKILSPDQQWMAIVTSQSKGGTPARKVGYVTYRDRFAQWKEHDRPLAEDPKGNENERWIYLQKVNDPIDDGTKESAVEVFHHPGGKEQLRITNPEWSKDSKKIVFRTYDPETEEIVIYTASVDSTEKARAIHQARNSGTQRSPDRIQPQFTSDGAQVIASFDDSGFTQPWLIDPLTKGKVPVLRGNFDAEIIAFDDPGNTLFVLANKEHPVRRDIYAVEFRTGAMRKLTTREGVYSDPAVSPDGRHYAACFTNWEQLAELAAGTVDPATEELITDSHPNTIAQLNQLKPQLFSFQNKEGQTIQGMLFLPPNHKKENHCPITIYTYGGPLGNRSMVDYGGFGTYNYRFPMYMAKRHGYIAAVIDPRGSSNYGSFFESANWEQPGKPQVDDLADGVAHLVKEYGGDPNRVSLYGWSFGGFVTQMALYTKPDVFTVGMAGAGPTEWENYYGSYTSVTISDSQENQPDQRKFSLLPLAKNLKGRLLLLHGIEDTNVLFQDTVKVYQELLKAGKGTQVELFLDTTGGHHFGGDIKYNYIFWLFEDFLLRTLGSGNPDLLPGKTAEASSAQENGTACFANDAKIFTSWRPKPEEKEPWWKVDLGCPHNVSGVELNWEYEQKEYKYKVEGSSDGCTWILLADRSSNSEKSKSQRLYFDARSVRHLRVTLLGWPEGEAAALVECKAYAQ